MSRKILKYREIQKLLKVDAALYTELNTINELHEDGNIAAEIFSTEHQKKSAPVRKFIYFPRPIYPRIFVHFQVLSSFRNLVCDLRLHSPYLTKKIK